MSASLNQMVENPGPIIRGGERGDIWECATPGPMMRDTLRGWVRPITVGIVTIKTQDSVATETVKEFSTTGFIKRTKSRAVKNNPEGQRAWRWYSLFTASEIDLKLDDIVVVKGVKYRVMGQDGLTDFGFFKYYLDQDYINVVRQAE